MSAKLPEINDQNSQEILKKEGTVIIDFSATWCGPCKKLAPIFEEIAEEFKEKADFYSCDIENAQNFAMSHSVMSVPTIAVFQNGEAKDFIVGFQSKEKLLAKLQSYL